MTAKCRFTGFAAFAATLGVCSVAHANSLSPYIYFWPGVISISLAYAFPASLLAAFIERPFLTAAGIRRHPLVFSLRANFLSTLAGIVLIPIGYPALYVIGPPWCIAAFGVSCAVEVFYLRRFSQQSLTWGRIVVGNAASSAVLMILPPIAVTISQNHYDWAFALEPHQTWMACASIGLSVCWFLASFAWPMAVKTDKMPSDSVMAAATSSEVDAETTA